MLVKILGAVDIVAALSFLMIAFGIRPPIMLILFSAGLLFLKGLFIIKGDILSAVDIFSSISLLVSIFVTPPIIIIWIPSFLLLSKGVVSFM